MNTAVIAPNIGSRILRRPLESSHYSLRLTSSRNDLRAAQFLRFLVFNLELNEGLERSFHTCLDSDRFDDVCDHLIVEDNRTREVVGTYRLQTGAKALANLGFYSAQEFLFEPYLQIQSEIVELGRACVHIAHRNLQVLGLLWRGIQTYARQRQCRYLIGCSSLSSQNISEGSSVFHQLAIHLAEQCFQTIPLASFSFPVEETPVCKARIPKLLAAYLSLGAKICGPPAIDREFGTIDFLTLIDLNQINASAMPGGSSRETN